MKKRMISLLAAGILVVGSLTGCGNTTETESPAAQSSAPAAQEAAPEESSAAQESAPAEESSAAEVAEANTDLSGSVSMSGSTSMEKLANAVAESFMVKYPNVTVTAEFTGSSAGVESVLAGSCDIGNSSRALTEDEKAEGAVENIVAIDGIAVVVDPANTVTNLTKDQLISIYTGETTNWSEVGGPDMAIVVVGRESGSGTRGAFEELLGIEDACKYAQELDSTGGVATTVSSTEGAIGYVSLDALDDTVKAIQIDGVDATEENIVAGTYPLQRPFVMATKGEISEQSELVQEFFNFIYSEQGQDVGAQVGLITVDGPSAE